jgi:photosystem I P700 chlorophyll a apoprotein A2
MTIWGGNAAAFNESSTYIMVWLCDYPWLNSSPLINAFGINVQDVWGVGVPILVPSLGNRFHVPNFLAWFIETLIWAHERTPIANRVRWKDKPIALSTVQARLVGLSNFTIGFIFTFAPFVIASTTGKFR